MIKNIWRRYVDNIFSKDDFRELSSHINEEVESFEEISSDVWQESQSMTTDTPNKEDYYREARRLLMRIEHSKRLWWYRISVATVSVAAVLCVILVGMQYIGKTPGALPQVSQITAFSSFGEKKNVTLPDGTKVMLNSCTMLRYPSQFVGNQRIIELNGEAFFDVYHNSAKPFIVKTRRMNVKVLGTRFNLKSYLSDQIISVFVERGKVQVDYPDAMMRLSAHQQILINTSTGDYNKRCDMYDVGAWRKGTLRFDCTPIQDVVRELERVYGCHIILSNDEFNNHISGEHDNKTLESVLNSIHFITGGDIKYKYQGKDIILYK